MWKNMKNIKKAISILLVAVLLCGGLAIAGTAAAPAPAQSRNITIPAPPAVGNNVMLQQLVNLFLTIIGAGQMTDIQARVLIGLLQGLNRLGVDYSEILEWATPLLPMSVRNMLHDEGLAHFPIWQRSLFWNMVFYWLLFGWIWM